MPSVADYKRMIYVRVREEVSKANIDALWSEAEAEYPNADANLLYKAARVAAVETAIGNLDERLKKPDPDDNLDRLKQRSSDLWRLHRTWNDKLSAAITTANTASYGAPRIGRITRTAPLMADYGYADPNDPKFYGADLPGVKP